MNSSYSSYPSVLHRTGFSDVSVPDHITTDLVLCVIQFVLASTFAALLGSRHVLWYGVLTTCLRACQGLKSASFVATALFSTSLLLINNLTRESKDSTRHNTESADRSANHTAAEDSPTSLSLSAPVLYPSRTTHRRLYPSKHAFNYSYLLVGVPVLRKSVNVNPMISIYPTTSTLQGGTGRSPNGTSWFSIHATDYLQRGLSLQGLTLREKLDLYLTSQDIPHPVATYPHAYLVTAPRFLGFSFNPVSFWYLYDAKQQFTAMILEVNNTFDERRMYFLRNSDDVESSTSDVDEASPNDLHANIPSKRFTNKWRKDFHVSPFNDRDGTYSVNAIDVLRTGRVDVTIVLSGDDDKDTDTNSTHSSSPTKTAQSESQSQPHSNSTTKAKLIARIFSATHLNSTTLSSSQRLRFILRHGYIGFLTNPRILFEARKLWWEKGLSVFYRPEPLNTTIPRVETVEETVIERWWREVLDQGGRREGVEIEYISAAGVDREVMLRLGRVKQDKIGHGNGGGNVERTERKLRIHVLTPAFYSELVMVDGRDSGLEGFFKRFCFNAKPEEKMIDCSSAELLDVILAGGPSLKGDVHMSATKGHSVLNSITSGTVQTLVDRLRSSRSRGLMSLLRPPDQSSTSAFDKHVRQITTTDQYSSYLRAVLTILLADKLALGSVALLRFEIRLLRIPLVLFTTATVMRIVSHFFQVRHGYATDQSRP